MAVRSPLADLPKNDRKRFYDITLGFMFVAASALIGRTVGDALFLETFSASDLAYMYPATALTICAVAYGYARLASRWPLARLIGALSLLLAVTCVALRFALGYAAGNHSRVAAYILGDLIVNLPMLLFWSFAAQCFAPGQAKRLFGLVGAGGTVACIGAGFVVKPLADTFGTHNLLFLIAILMVGFAWVVRRTSKRDAIGRQAPDSAGDGSIGSLSSLLSKGQIQAIVALMLAATATLTLVDYQFKAGTRLNVPSSDLASFFGTFYGLASAASLILQLFVVHRVLQKGGVFAGLVIMPVGLLVASAVTWATQSFGWTVATKFVVQIFAFTIDSAALQMLYLGITRQSRSQARALAEGIGKPLATGLTGLALIALAQPATLHHLSIAAVTVAVIWIVLTRLNHNAYISALAESLGNQKFDVSQETAALHDIALESHIRESMDSADDEEIVYLLGILPIFEEVDWLNQYRSLLPREDPRIKIAALAYLRVHGEEVDVAAIVDLLSHHDPLVREGAVDAIHALGQPEHMALIEQCLEDSAPEVRAAAIAALIDSEDLDHLLSAGAELRTMLASSEQRARVAAANALGRLERGGLVRPLIGLLQDESTEVLRAALQACLRQRDPKLIPAIAPLLANPKVAALAGDTLSEFGSAALDHLIPYIEMTDTEGAFPGGHAIPPILAGIGDADAIPAILTAIESPDPALRSSAIRAFAQMVTDQEMSRERRPEIEQLAIQELRASRVNQSRANAVCGLTDCDILHAALTQVSEAHLGNAFVLLDTITPSVRMMFLLPSLKIEGEARNNAVEVLENVLRGEVRTELLTTISGQTPPVSSPTAEILNDIVEEGCANWVRIGALYASGKQQSADLALLDTNLCHSNSVVRETTLDALSHVSPERAKTRASTLENDDSPIVRDVANRINSEAA